MRFKRILGALGVAGAMFTTNAMGTLLSNEIIAQPLLGTYTFFATDVAEVNRYKVSEVIVSRAKTQADLDELMAHDVDPRVINGLKLQLLVNELPPEHRKKFQELIDSTQTQGIASKMKWRDDTVTLMLVISTIAALAFTLGCWVNRNEDDPTT